MSNNRKIIKTRIELAPIEKLLLPLALTSDIPKTKQMIYIAIRKFDDLSVASSPKSLKVMVSKYWHSEPVMDYLNMVRKEKMTDEEKDEAGIEEDVEEDDVSRDDLIKSLKKLSKDTDDEKMKLDVTKTIASLKGFNRQQASKAPTKNIYVTHLCHDCILYKNEEKLLTNNNEEDDNSK